MNQNDPCSGNNFEAGDDEVFDGDDDLRFDEVLMVIDGDSLVAARDTEEVNQAKEQLKEIVSTLANSHVVTSFPLTTDQLKRFLLCSFWSDTHSAEMKNVRACAIEWKT